LGENRIAESVRWAASVLLHTMDDQIGSCEDDGVGSANADLGTTYEELAIPVLCADRRRQTSSVRWGAELAAMKTGSLGIDVVRFSGFRHGTE
jgi:hypothetical protein